MQHEILDKKPLLDENGQLTEPGFAKSLILDYDRNAIKAPNLRIKEWDYYLITNDDFAIALTIDDNSYMGLDSISFIDFRAPFEITTSKISAFTMGKVGFPASSSIGDINRNRKNYSISFVKDSGTRTLTFHMENFHNNKPIDGKIILYDVRGDSMVIATPFDKPGHFYYNQKINCMPASGSVNFDGKKYVFEPKSSFGVLDWGRGVWTYKNTWYWGSASGAIDNVPFGFNIGYGFGDTSAASENMIFYDQKAHKLDQVTFNIPTTSNGNDDFMSPWTFTSNDGRFEMEFVPIIDRAADSNVGIIRSNQHQVFGLFSGKAILDDGTVINVKDFLGFAEKVFNKW